MQFEKYKSVVYALNRPKKFNKIAAFDLDGTLIDTKSGKKFPQNKNDWKFFNENVPEILKKLIDEGHKIIIFTNQKGIGKNENKINDFKDKINDIREALNIDFDIFIATEDDYFRKPMTGMWCLFTCFYQFHINLKESFYCGDAAGRPRDWLPGKKKDFSCSDWYFAQNIGLPFNLPDNVFRDKEQPYRPIFHDCPYINTKKLLKGKCKFTPKSFKGGPELILMIGRPASGKSWWARQMIDMPEFKNYAYINMDTCGSKKKCISQLKTAVKEKKSIIVDNTNPAKDSRIDYINIAKDVGMHIKVYWFDIPEELSKHLNKYRAQISKSQIKVIPDIAYNIYNKYFQPPNVEEGIDEIFKIPFCFIGNDNDKKLFLYHY